MCARQGAWRRASAIESTGWLVCDLEVQSLAEWISAVTPDLIKAEAKLRPDEQESHMRQTYRSDKAFLLDLDPFHPRRQN